MQEPLQSGLFRPRSNVGSPAMSFPTGHIWDRLLDRLDLLVDFATLGEYGLEWEAGPQGPRPHNDEDRP
jgi:hypothetical protein